MINSNTKRIKGYEKYSINKEGRVFGHRDNKWLKPSINKDGYNQVSIRINGENKDLLVHELVAKAYLNIRKDRTFLSHKDNNKLNNSIRNLEWIEPIKHELDDVTILVIKKLLERGNMKQKEIADYYGIKARTISNIKLNKKLN